MDEAHVIELIDDLLRDLDADLALGGEVAQLRHQRPDEADEPKIAAVVLTVLEVVLFDAEGLVPQILLVLEEVVLAEELLLVVL